MLPVRFGQCKPLQFECNLKVEYDQDIIFLPKNKIAGSF